MNTMVFVMPWDWKGEGGKYSQELAKEDPHCTLLSTEDNVKAYSCKHFEMEINTSIHIYVFLKSDFIDTDWAFKIQKEKKKGGVK